MILQKHFLEHYTINIGSGESLECIGFGYETGPISAKKSIKSRGFGRIAEYVDI